MMSIIAELGHWVALVPLIACLMLILDDKPPRPEALLLSCAFFLSYIADSVGAFFQVQHIPNLWLAYFYAPLQFALFAWIIAPDRKTRVVAVGGIVLCALTSGAVQRANSVELVTQILGGALVSIMVLEQKRFAAFRPALLVYCLSAMPFLFIMGRSQPATSGPWVYAWIGYQTVRAVALILFTVALVRRPRLKVAHDYGTGEAASGRRRPIGGSSGAHRHAITPIRKTG